MRTTVVTTNHDQTNLTFGDDGLPAGTAVAMDDPLAGLAPGRADLRVPHAHKGEDPPARPLRGPLAPWEMGVGAF